MASKLTDITTTYHTFVKDQVLTETQLNEFLDYFEDQDRLSRISLSGVGIVCGFEPSIEVVTVDGKLEKQIRVKQGCGVTTDGDLLNLREKGSKDPLKKIDVLSSVFTNYRKFEDTNADYLPFKNNGPNFQMWEAIRQEEVSNAAQEPRLTEFVNLENMVALLYLECYPDSSNLCDELSCDSQGIHQVARLRVLLVNQANASMLLSKDTVFSKHDLMSVYQQMKDLAVPRIVLNNVLTGQGNTNTATQLVDSYKLSNFASTITDLKSGLQLMANKLTPYYPDHGIDAMLTMIDSKLPSAGATPQLFFQYRYDLLKDVADTYNELKDWFVKVATECCPSITAFPKHLMLGKLVPNETDTLEGRYRHKFYRSPILVDGASGFEVFRSVLKRLGEMLKNYPILPETNSGTGLLRSEVRITPSSFRTVLGNKAIPFYYNLTDALLRSWNFEKTRLGKHKRNLSYNKTGVDTALDLSPAIQQPLRYNLEPHSFFRIEGHQGRDYTEVLGKIDTIKKENALSFDVKALCVDLDTNFVIDPEDYECEFEDLAVLLEAWVGEQNCSISKSTALLSSYSLSQPGYNLQEETYTGPIGVVYDPPIFDANTVKEDVSFFSAKAISSGKSGITLSKDEQLQVAKTQAIETNKQNFGGRSGVIDNLTVKEDTVGGAFLYAIQNQPNGQPNDHVLAANYYVDKYIEEQQILWDPDIKVILVDNTFHLLAYLQALSNSIPISVAGINDNIITKYDTNINNLCSTLQKLQVTYTDASTQKLTSKNRAILGLLINQLTAICCAAKQLQALLKEIDSRKDAILERLTLKKFIAQHPGLEHLGGVENGGTFVLVYLRKGNNVNGAVQNVPNGTVVADFSLPYMCCSDCAPINFIVPKAPVFLHLPKDTVCLGKDIEKLIFDVEPIDGVIKADQEITGLTISGNELSINPLTFDKTKLGQVIKFTVNEQVTNCQLTVREPLAADFEIPVSPVDSTLVDFKALGNFPEGTKFEWNFGDGNVSTLDAVSHNYVLPLASGGNKVDVTLKVIPPDGSCPTIITKSFTFEALSIDITPKTFCNNDSVKYPFTIKPVGASPIISGLGVSADGSTFAPLGLIPGGVPILMNGVPYMVLQVNTPPTVIMNANIVNGALTMTSNVTDTMTYKWVFEDAAGAAIHAPITDNPNPVIQLTEIPNVKPGEPFTVTLYVESPCGQVKQQKALLMPATNVTISMLETNYCNTDDGVYGFIILPEGAQATITGPGVDSAQQTFSPYGLPAGSAVISLNGQPALALTIGTSPVVSFTVSIQNDVMTLESNLTDAVNTSWSFLRADGTEIIATIENEISLTIPMSEFIDMKQGDVITIILIAKNQCGEERFIEQITVPTESNTEACNADALTDLKGIREQVVAMMNGDVYKRLTDLETTRFLLLLDELDKVQQNPGSYLNGGSNGQVVEFFQSSFNNLTSVIFEYANQETRQLFYYLYKAYVASFYAILQCQSESTITENSGIISILNGINSNTDPKNSNGFWPLQLTMDETPGLKEFVLTVIQYRPAGTQSRSLMQTLYNNLAS